MHDTLLDARDDHRPISLAEAARLVDPRPGQAARQVDLLRAELAAGRLAGQRQGGDGRHWTTTRRALAEYLARQRVARTAAAGDPRGEAARRRPSEPRRQAESAVRDAWREYFLAVMLARTPRHATGGFRAAVVAGQLALVALAIALAWRAAAPWASPSFTPEQRAVVRWLEANAPQYRIEEWLPAAGDHAAGDDDKPVAADGAQVELRYTYRGPHGRAIDTARRFTIREGQVVRVDSR